MTDATIARIEDVYRRQYARFVRVAYAMLGDRERALDAVQEAFARAIRSRFDFRGEGSIEAWLWRTLTNVCLDVHREGSRPEPEGEAPRMNGHAEEWPELRAAVALLPERQRLVLFLRHYADLDYETIAAALGIARGTVAATLNAAHRALRGALTEVHR